MLVLLVIGLGACAVFIILTQKRSKGMELFSAVSFIDSLYLAIFRVLLKK